MLINQHKRTIYETLELDYVGVKAPQFSYQRLKGANPVAHVEMASTGEVACLGENLQKLFFVLGLRQNNLLRQAYLVSIAEEHKSKLLPLLKQLDEADWEIYTTEGTHNFLSKNGVASYFVYKTSEANEPNLQLSLPNIK